MTVFDGSMEQDIGGKQSATMPSVPQIQALSENARLSLAADGIATMMSSTIELSYTYQDGSPIMGAPYTIRFANGTELTGNLDDSGKAKIENAPPVNTPCNMVRTNAITYQKIIALKPTVWTNHPSASVKWYAAAIPHH
ncbi:hypothetical protein CWC29_019850 [Pseudoalteromonas sp. S4498]|uniref:Uncharacterized protein n=1 Tax=Pseudoalteromonas galatheae TaxID=579562 RepID=A0A8T6YWG7_9GAMM|nr:hypothetical protein [Pseudoalteromonas galatheae]NKC21038.1 hypothetical protein [Pseudoalteromonas galatheae]